MLDGQQYSLDLLQLITPDDVTGRSDRSAEEFLVSTVKGTVDNTIFPEQWPGGWCKDWAFCVGANFAAALDVCQTQRVDKDSPLNEASMGNKKGKSESKPTWTQGSAFDFKKGYTIHHSPIAYDVWGVAVQHIGFVLQIEDASPAVPAHIENAKFDSESKMLDAAEKIKDISVRIA